VLATTSIHWIAANGPKWAVTLGLFEPPTRGERPGGASDLPGVQEFLNGWRGTAEMLGEWAFYAMVVLIALAPIKRFPYRYSVSTHTLIAVAYLALVAHAAVLLDFASWTRPLGIVVGMLMVGGVVSAVLALLRQASFRQDRGRAHVSRLARHGSERRPGGGLEGA